MVRSSSPGHGPQGADIALAPVLSELGCACSHLRGLVGFLREHGHRSSDAQKPIPFYGIGSVTNIGRDCSRPTQVRAKAYACPISVVLLALCPSLFA